MGIIKMFWSPFLMYVFPWDLVLIFPFIFNSYTSFVILGKTRDCSGRWPLPYGRRKAAHIHTPFRVPRLSVTKFAVHAVQSKYALKYRIPLPPGEGFCTEGNRLFEASPHCLVVDEDQSLLGISVCFNFHCATKSPLRAPLLKSTVASHLPWLTSTPSDHHNHSYYFFAT